MFSRVNSNKKARVADRGHLSAFDFDMELEEEEPRNTFKAGTNNSYFPASFKRKLKLPVTSFYSSSERQAQQITEKLRDENQVSTSGRDSMQGASKQKNVMSCSNEVAVTASRARLGQQYGRFMNVIFSSKHIEVKKTKDILSRTWLREDLCEFKSYYKFHSESADEKAIVVLRLHGRRVFGHCSDGECRNPDDLTEILVMEIANIKWVEQQRRIMEMSQCYRKVWKRIESDKQMLELKGKLSRFPLEELASNADPTRKIEVEFSSEKSSTLAWIRQELHTFETLVFPEGDPDAVTITRKDLDVLRPMGFLNDTIIDFYIKYLQKDLTAKAKERFYFFNSFFFRKLVEASKTCTESDQCKVAYERVRKWTRKVNLFEKDYIFIPVNQSLHWSLIIICHLGSLGSSSDKRMGTPCILHLDSMEGSHEGVEQHIRNYILQAWIEKHQGLDLDPPEGTLSHMKYLEAKVPQQNNHCDCGTYLLHYVELFLRAAPSHFSLTPSRGFPYFLTRDWFKSSEASVKRKMIRSLLVELHQRSISNATSEQATPPQMSGELEAVDDDDVCISSGDEVIHYNFVASLQTQISEELRGAAKQDEYLQAQDVAEDCSMPMNLFSSFDLSL